MMNEYRSCTGILIQTHIVLIPIYTQSVVLPHVVHWRWTRTTFQIFSVWGILYKTCTQSVSWYSSCVFQRTKSCHYIYAWLCPPLVATCCPLFAKVKRCSLPPFVMPLLWNPVFENGRRLQIEPSFRSFLGKAVNAGFILKRLFHRSRRFPLAEFHSHDH